MYQQQYLLIIRSKIPAEILDSGSTHHALHFVAKVQDSSGNWFRGEQYNKFEPAASLGDTKDIECIMAIYLGPGEHTVAMIAYDSTTRKANIARQKISIHPSSSEPLPQLDAHIPSVEFPDDFPAVDTSRIERSDGEMFAIGHPRSPFPAPNGGNVRIDIVINISKQEHTQPEAGAFAHGRNRDYGGFDPYGGRRRSDQLPPPDKHVGLAIGRVLQSASVLSHFGLTSGCIYVTAVDPIRVKVALPAKPSTEIDWDKLQPELFKFDQNMIDARVLQNHKAPGMFLHDLFDKISDDSGSCGSGPVTAHYVVVVSPTLTLPEFNGDMRISKLASERAKFYYFHPVSENPYGDDLGKILKTANPRRFDYGSPEAFRKALASFFADLHAAN